MKIVLLGSNGMAGHMITKYLKSKNFNVLTVARNNADCNVDVENKDQLDNFLQSQNAQCDFMINCIGYLQPDSLKNPAKAIMLNSWFPQYLAQSLYNRNTRLIHISTDCVFDGKQGNYTEQDAHTETNVYGRSKSLGEISNNKDITFRMSIIGPELKSNGSGLFQWIYTNKESTLSGWENAWWNGITTLQLAKCIEKYINDPKITGIYNVVNNNVNINKFDLLSKINNIFGLNKTINKTQGPKTVNKILVDTRKEFEFDIPDYDTQLVELKEFMSR
jgi:dTDP-4-dehydrorhamnose reductase